MAMEDLVAPISSVINYTNLSLESQASLRTLMRP